MYKFLIVPLIVLSLKLVESEPHLPQEYIEHWSSDREGLYEMYMTKLNEYMKKHGNKFESTKRLIQQKGEFILV